MCIAFFWLNDNNDDSVDYKLILVMNRDEFMVRKTEEANWGPNGVLCGRDMEPGKEGGTWLGVNKRGEIAFLTNIFTGMQPEKSGAKIKGRGFLVVDFLKDGGADATQYLETLSTSEVKYSPFNLVLLEPNEELGRYVPHYYRPESKYCDGQLPVCLMAPESNVYGFSNSPYSRPYKKVSRTAGSVETVIEEFRKSGNGDEDRLINDLFATMTSRCREKEPDPQMLRQKDPESLLPDEHLRALTSTFVDVGTVYGTRTQTVIIVDGENNVTFAERTRESAGKDDPLKWMETNKFKFKIEE